MDIDIDLLQFFLALNNMQLSRSDHYKKYKKVRALHQEVDNGLCNYLSKHGNANQIPISKHMKSLNALARDGFTGKIGERMRVEMILKV